MNTINTINGAVVSPNQSPVGTLAPVLGSAAIMPLEGYSVESSAGHNTVVMKSRGASSRIPFSMAVEVPEFTLADVTRALSTYPLVGELFIKALADQQRELIVRAIEGGAKVLQYSEITLDKVCSSIVPTVRAAKMSGDSIKSWYNLEAAEVMAVYIADRLGVSENPTDADMVKIAQVSNQVRDNLAKLASPNASFAEPVRASLNRSLDYIIASGLDSGLAGKLQSKLNPAQAADKVNLLDML